MHGDERVLHDLLGRARRRARAAPRAAPAGASARRTAARAPRRRSRRRRSVTRRHASGDAQVRRRSVYTRRRPRDEMASVTDASDCLFCKIVAGDDPGGGRAHDRADGRVPRHQPAGADPRARGAARPLRERRRARRRRPGRLRRAGRPPPPRSPPRRGYDDYRLVFNTGAGAGQTVFHTHLHLLGGPLVDLAARMSRRARRSPRGRSLLVAGAARVRRAASHEDARPPDRLAAELPTPPTRPSVEAAQLAGGQAGQAAAAAQGREPDDADHAGGLHAVGADRRRHRRLPLLPARPAPGPRTPGSPAPTCCPATRRRPPRDPVPGRRPTGRRGRGQDAADPGRGLDLLRRHRPRRRVRPARRRAVARRLGARWRRDRSPATATASRSTPGSRIVMQVHYNLLAGRRSRHVRHPAAARCRAAPTSPPLHTFLLPAPVELPCRPGHDDGPLCDRDAAVADVKARFGAGPGTPPTCSTCSAAARPRRPRRTTCTRTVSEPMTILGVAGHMHLLGRVDQDRDQPRHPARPGPSSTSRSGTSTTRARSRSSRSTSTPGDTVRVTCRHVSGCATGCRRSRASRNVRRVGRGHAPTRCASGMLQVAFDDEPAERVRTA